MSAVPHHVHVFATEPEERDDPRNELLNAFEQFVDALEANDLRAPLVARIKGRFPELVAVAPLARGDSPAGSRPPRAGEQEGATKDAMAAAGPLGLEALIRELRRLEKLKMNALAHEAVRVVKAAAEAALPGTMTQATEADHA